MLLTMGTKIIDRFSLLHFAAGIVVYYWGLDFKTWLLVNVVFEILENSMYGMWFIKNVSRWPGGKTKADSLLNSTSDITFGALGWLFASHVAPLL